mmetsp:Transcript_143895/g.261802  ORF Transcript_143895/g.261802 Transcript_143895/m.261802 type:complete len:215 (+) Transcript_143895:3-647(+)
MASVVTRLLECAIPHSRCIKNIQLQEASNAPEVSTHLADAPVKWPQVSTNQADGHSGMFLVLRWVSEGTSLAGRGYDIESIRREACVWRAYIMCAADRYNLVAHTALKIDGLPGSVRLCNELLQHHQLGLLIPVQLVEQLEHVRAKFGKINGLAIFIQFGAIKQFVLFSNLFEVCILAVVNLCNLLIQSDQITLLEHVVSTQVVLAEKLPNQVL